MYGQELGLEMYVILLCWQVGVARRMLVADPGFFWGGEGVGGLQRWARKAIVRLGVSSGSGQ